VNARDAIQDTGIITLSTKNISIDHQNSEIYSSIKEGNYILIEVKDNGCGMDASIKNRIFEPYFTTKEIGKGTGLGLSTVFEIVKQNHGHINVDSHVNIGTAFQIFFPVYQGEVSNNPIEEIKSAPEGNKQKILLVEDEKQILEMLYQYLTKLNYEVIPIENPKEALAIINNDSKEIHLLITDIMMPELRGFYLHEAMIKSKRSIKTLFTTGYIEKIDTLYNINEDDIELIRKPINLHLFAEKIYDLLHN